MSRMVSVEFTIFNPNTDIYSIVNFIVEVPPFGGVFVSRHVVSTKHERYVGGFAIFLGALEILFLIITVFFIYREVFLEFADKKSILATFAMIAEE